MAEVRLEIAKKNIIFKKYVDIRSLRKEITKRGVPGVIALIAAIRCAATVGRGCGVTETDYKFKN